MNAHSVPAGRERSTLLREPQTAIRAGEIHVWHGTLEASPDPVTPAEEARARRMRSPRRRREFLVCRGALRRVLAGALGIEPLAVPILAGAHGKPRLDSPRPPAASLPPAGFNVSHSGERFVVAVAIGMNPGVDIERIRPRRSLSGLARRFFSAAEQGENRRRSGPAARVLPRLGPQGGGHQGGRARGIHRARPLRRERRRAGRPAACPLGGSGPRRSGPLVAPLARARSRLRGRARRPESRRRR